MNQRADESGAAQEENSKQLAENEEERKKDPKNITEYRQGFLSKDKIVRTPPEEQRKRAMLNQQH